MDTTIRRHFGNLGHSDPQSQYASFQFLLEHTNQPVDWIYDIWDELLSFLKSKDNHLRTIAVQLFSNLAKSDHEHRLYKDLDKLIAVTRDERFVTARHSLQCLWKVGLPDPELRTMLIARLKQRFEECISDKNCTLIRYDILEVLKKIYDQTSANDVKNTALALIETEADPKYKKKYSTLWKSARTNLKS